MSTLLEILEKLKAAYLSASIISIALRSNRSNRLVKLIGCAFVALAFSTIARALGVNVEDLFEVTEVGKNN